MKQMWLLPHQPRSPGRTLPAREQPVARVLRDSTACSSVELLAALIGGPAASAAAAELLMKYQSLPGLAQASVTELTQVRGIGDTAAARLRAALQLAPRLQRETHDPKTIQSPADAASIFCDYLIGKEQECLLVMMLNTRHGLIEVVELYRGSLNTTTIRIGEIFREAIRRNAASILIAHNHPSLTLGPSSDDVAVTKLMVEAGKLLDIVLVDHLIICGQRFVSLKERGLIFS